MSSENYQSQLISVMADNYQILLQDKFAECEYPEDWNDYIASQLIAVGNHVVGVGTIRDQEVEIELLIAAAPLSEQDIDRVANLEDFDHVAQCSIDLPSGALLLTAPAHLSDQATQISLEPGQYGVRVFWSGLDTLDDLGFEGEDRYRVVMWPDTELPFRIFKVWRPLYGHTGELTG